MQINIKGLIDDAQCYATVREWRWPEGRQCPFCASKGVIRRGFDDKEPARQRYEWKDCKKRFDKHRAEQVLWCYANAKRLARRGLWTLCADEIPNYQILERHPIRCAIPGHIEHQEFEYSRHGTVNILVFLIVHTGRIEVIIEDTKDAAHYIQALKRFRQRHHHLKGVFLVQDGDPSHTADVTRRYLADGSPWRHSLYTPIHTSWLNQAEIAIHGFRHYYLKRRSWHTREAFIEHVLVSWPEYNRRYAHPIVWTWTNQKMRQWFEKHTP
jgi:hypothetical protein